MKFNYKARTKEGDLQVGNIDASSRDAAVNVLLTHGLFVLSVEYVKENSILGKFSSFLRE